MSEEQLKLARKLLRQGKSIRYVADTFGFGVHFTTLYRYLRAAGL
jgi:transposase